MSEIAWVIIGMICVLFGILMIYPSQAYIKMRLNKSKIQNIFLQIEGQVSIKYNLLKEYLEINKDSIEEEKYKEITERLNAYGRTKNVDILKDFNIVYSYYMHSFDDHLLSKQCKDSEEKIGYIKEYYNELVCFYNRYKSNKVNSFVAKIMAIDDEKLY